MVSDNTPGLVWMSQTWTTASILQRHSLTHSRRATSSGSSPALMRPATTSIRHGMVVSNQIGVHFAGPAARVAAIAQAVGVYPYLAAKNLVPRSNFDVIIAELSIPITEHRSRLILYNFTRARRRKRA